jgi:hypothetical protein
MRQRDSNAISIDNAHTTPRGSMRKTFAVVASTLVAVLAACSGTDTLSPAPTTDQQGGSTHADTTIVNGPQDPPPPLPPVVASFALSGVVYGHESGPDTTKVIAVPNVSITLVKVGEVTGDTLKPSVTVATTTTDANGAYRIENLKPAYYRIDVTPPSGSPFGSAIAGIGPAREPEVKVTISLWRTP